MLTVNNWDTNSWSNTNSMSKPRQQRESKLEMFRLLPTLVTPFFVMNAPFEDFSELNADGPTISFFLLLSR